MKEDNSKNNIDTASGKLKLSNGFNFLGNRTGLAVTNLGVSIPTSTKNKKGMQDFICCPIDNINLTAEKLKKYCQVNRFALKEVI